MQFQSLKSDNAKDFPYLKKRYVLMTVQLIEMAKPMTNALFLYLVLFYQLAYFKMLFAFQFL